MLKTGNVKELVSKEEWLPTFRLYSNCGRI